MCNVAIHPTLGIAVRSDGAVCVRNRYSRKFHWFYGWKDADGYLKVKANGKDRFVHRLIAETFIPNPENKPQIDHFNRNRADNMVENLRWVTHKENSRNTEQHDRVESRGGTHRYLSVNAYLREWRHRRNDTHKRVLFSDKTHHWVLNSEAEELLKLPVKKRHYGNG